MSDGMPAMTHRTTFALDPGTADRLLRLSVLWQVSQAEVVRRSVEQAEKLAATQKPDRVRILRQLHESGGALDRKTADAWVAEVYKDRERWRKQQSASIQTT